MNSTTEEKFAFLTNVFLSLYRSDQDEWLRVMGLAREAEGTGLASTASMRGFTNVSDLVTAARSPQRNAAAAAGGEAGAAGSSSGNVVVGTSRNAKFDLGSPRVAAALRLVGEDHKPEHETARPRAFDITRRGASGKEGGFRAWFNQAAGPSTAGGGASPHSIAEDEGMTPSASALVQAAEEAAPPAPEPTLLTLPRARKEWLAQDHMGTPNPDKAFDAQVSRFPDAKRRGGLTFEEFVAVFSCFEYN